MEVIKRSLIVLMLFITACGGGSKKDPQPVLSPVKTQLILPANNQPCLTGTNMTATKSTVTFSWQAADNADKYLLYIKDLVAGTITSQTVSGLTAAKELLIGIPYSWYVVSASSNTSATAQSDTWKFYNSGPGVTFYAPYPANLTSPAYGEQVSAASAKIILTWNVTATSTNVKEYDVYFGTDKNPVLYKEKIVAATLTVDVLTARTYYWKIVARDNNGNTSLSQVSYFNVK
jgi:hypothetical protein